MTFGRQQINFHPRGSEVDPKALALTPGSAELCFICAGSLATIQADLERKGVAIELGPVARAGVTGGIRSLYVRDPDAKLIELAIFAGGPPGLDSAPAAAHAGCPMRSRAAEANP